MLKDYAAAEMDSLEHELRIACANASRLQALFDASPTRGVPVSVSRAGGNDRSLHIYPYARLLQEQLDLIRKLKLAQKALEAASRGDMEAIEVWASTWSHRGVPHRSSAKSLAGDDLPDSLLPEKAE